MRAVNVQGTRAFGVFAWQRSVIEIVLMIVRKWIFAIKLNKNSMSLPQQ